MYPQILFSAPRRPADLRRCLLKNTRRRRHLRPRPSRSQINQQIRRARSLLNLFRTEWLLEIQQEQPRPAHLRFLHDRFGEINYELAWLERQ